MTLCDSLKQFFSRPSEQNESGCRSLGVHHPTESCEAIHRENGWHFSFNLPSSCQRKLMDPSDGLPSRELTYPTFSSTTSCRTVKGLGPWVLCQHVMSRWCKQMRWLPVPTSLARRPCFPPLLGGGRFFWGRKKLRMSELMGHGWWYRFVFLRNWIQEMQTRTQMQFFFHWFFVFIRNICSCAASHKKLTPLSYLPK